MKYQTLLATSLLVALTGCSTTQPNQSKNTGFSPLQGPSITTNDTRYTRGLACVSDRINISSKVRISVGQIPDKTGKVNTTEGYKLTQGVESMAITALAKIPAIQVVERRNLETYNIEAKLMRQKLIGDGRKYQLSNGKKINYRPMLSGSVKGADYYITGAVTEVNYNIYSGGHSLNVSGFELGTRTVAMNVAMDLRLVDVKTLDVIDAISLQKQFIGKQTKAGLYRFVDSELVTYNGGRSIDEPLQLGVRAIVERGTAQLVGRLFGVRVDECYGNDVVVR